MTHSLPPRRPLPHRLRLLFVGPAEPPWALLALRLESAGCAQAEFDWEQDVSAALARLRKVTFDCLIVHGQATGGGGQPPDLRFVEGLRGSGSDDPIVVIMPQPDDERTAQLEDLDCELLVSRAGWQSRALVSLIRRAIVRGDLCREISGLEVTARRGRLRERDEAETQLVQLQSMIDRLRQSHEEPPEADAAARRPEMTAKIEAFYQELLQAYVMMGSGNLTAELQKLADLLALAGITPAQTLAMHVGQVETLLQGLGNRSSRHVISRADLLALELVIRLGELYRRKSHVRGLGDAGVDLMHAESLLQRGSDFRVAR